ncbi:RodZ domain-containing protein [Wohlfahrtiimonas chitiniclastica]|uniref:RodZ domain-containing protein n=1 Tax=Wohlfahrtiimonas chitiniclastica TaxID=400946 RepID=UPI001BCF92AC|nr:RodZ domain-containing protein [Wohlfahrtiimonas chitiniclastica]MBS7836059.1 helix-turn-helix domain-containing protein [Wohlfahrtiimonas chitiniclastica]
MAKEELMHKFKEAREARNVSLQDAARVLSLRVQVLQDLEDGRYEQLGAMIYIKRYVRKYADYLKLDRDEIEVLLAKVDDPFANNMHNESLIRAQLNEEKRMVQRSFFKWYMWILLILCVIGTAAYFLYGEKTAELFNIKPTPDHIINYQETEAEVPAETVTSEIEAPIATETVTERVAPAPKKVEVEVPVAAAVSTVPVAAIDTKSALSDFELDQIIKTGKIELANQTDAALDVTDQAQKAPLPEGFSALSLTLGPSECWIQIKDKNQKVVMNEVLAGNATYHIEGKAPFFVHMGNAKAIDQMVLNGEVVDEKVYRPTARTTVSKIKLEAKEES